MYESKVEAEDIGRVIAVEDKFVTVTIDAAGACEGCAMNFVCQGTAAQINHKIKTDLELNVGDRVILHIDPAKKIWSALILFVLPLLFMIIGYYLGSHFFGGEILGIISGFVSLVFSFLVIWLIDKSFAKKVSLMIVAKYEDDVHEDNA